MPEQSNPIRRNLPRGRNALDRESVAASQQERLLEAICELTAREGYASITVNKLIARAGVAKPTFYEHFESKEACLFVWVDRAIQELTDNIVAAVRGEDSTEERVVRGVNVVVEFFMADIDRARVMLIEGFVAGGTVQQRIDEAYEQLAQFYRAMREESRVAKPDRPSMSIVRARAIVGAIKDPLAGALREGGAEQIPSIVEELIDGVTLLALGRVDAPD
jgi:AcrR family transcriptional regulator